MIIIGIDYGENTEFYIDGNKPKYKNEKLYIKKCVVCEGEDFKQSYIQETHSYVECKKCGYIFQQNVKSEEMLKELYSGDYDIHGSNYVDYEIKNEQNFLNLMLAGLKDLDIFNFADKYLSGKRMLDIGCAIGQLPEYFENKGWDAMGVDLSEEMIKHGHRLGRKLIHGTIFDIEKENYFDLIHTSNVLEHVLDPDLWLEQINNLLKKDGVLILTTPNSASLQRHIKVEEWRHIVNEDHIQIFNKSNLRKLLINSGFEIIEHFTWGGIAKGDVPNWMKFIIDKMAKKFGFGDMQLVFCRKVYNHHE